MTTYSLSITGADNSSVPLTKTMLIDDVYATPGGIQYAARTGTVFVAKGPDGQLYNSVFDTERCIPGGTQVIRRPG